MDYRVYLKGSYLEIEEIQGTLKFSVLKSNVTVLQHDTDKGRFYFHNVPNFDKLVDIENIKKEDLSAYTEENFVEFYTSFGNAAGGGLTDEELRASPLEVVTRDFYTEDVEEDTSNNTTFVGKQTNAGVWLLQKIVEATVGTKTTTTMEYASVLNNATKTTYASAWTDRATLTYSEIKNLL